MTTTDILDLPCLSARDVLVLLTLVADTKPRDGIRAAQDAVLDLVGLV